MDQDGSKKKQPTHLELVAKNGKRAGNPQYEVKDLPDFWENKAKKGGKLIINGEVVAVKE